MFYFEVLDLMMLTNYCFQLKLDLKTKLTGN